MRKVRGKKTRRVKRRIARGSGFEQPDPLGDRKKYHITGFSHTPAKMSMTVPELPWKKYDDSGREIKDGD